MPCLQATVLVAGQLPNINDPVLNADPLFGVTGVSLSAILTTAQAVACLMSIKHVTCAVCSKFCLAPC